MLKVAPDAETARSRAPIAFALVIDTSGSMSGEKLDRAIEAGHTLVEDDRLTPEDTVAVIQFDDEARTLVPLTPLTRKQAAHQALDSLRQYSGGTAMAKGIACARRELRDLPAHLAKRAFLLTDGETSDESECRSLAADFLSSNAPIIAVGIGVEYNETLLRDVAEISQGRPYHLHVDTLDSIINAEIGASVKEVVTDLQAKVMSVRGVVMESLTRVYSSLANIDLSSTPYRLGNVIAGDYTVFILEFTIQGIARPPSRARLAQVVMNGHAPGLGRREEFAPQDLFVTFTSDEAAIAEVDAEVLGYVQQKNVDRMVQDAINLAATDPAKARQTLQVASGMTQRIGNSAMTRMLGSALDELNKTGTISANTRKTVALGVRTKTVKTGSTSLLDNVPSDEDIRKLTGA